MREWYTAHLPIIMRWIALTLAGRWGLLWIGWAVLSGVIGRRYGRLHS